jgi:hypothetical protein
MGGEREREREREREMSSIIEDHDRREDVLETNLLIVYCGYANMVHFYFPPYTFLIFVFWL